MADVAGMLRSFSYAAWTPLTRRAATVRPEDRSALESWARYWCANLSQGFVSSYLSVSGIESIVPEDDVELSVLLDAYVLEKALYEVLYELNNRPDWVSVPLRGVLEILG